MISERLVPCSRPSPARNRITQLLSVLCGLVCALACVTRSTQSKEDRDRFGRYELDAPPAIAHPLHTQFGNRLELLGYAITPEGDLRFGQSIELTLYWKVIKPIDEGWQLFTHILDGEGRYLQNLDATGPLREENGGHPAFPPWKWQVGKIYVDEQAFNLSQRIPPGRVTLVTGLWKGKDRLTPSGGSHDGRGRAVVATRRAVKHEASSPNRPNPPRLRVPMLKGALPPTIDGRLDDPAWKQAVDTGWFVGAGDGSPVQPEASLRGHAWITWNLETLYVGFDVRDRNVVGDFDPKAIDPHLWTRDTVEMMVDPDGDGDNRDYYEIQVNPQNLCFDSLFDDYNQPRGGKEGPFGNQHWSAKLKSAVVVTGTLNHQDDIDRGYVVELAIPWSSFSRAAHSPPRPGDAWRANFYAMEDNGGIAWSPILGQGNFHRASRFGTLVFQN